MARRRSTSVTTTPRRGTGTPATIAAMMAVGILAAGVVRGDDDQVGALGRRPAHERALLGVTVAAAPEHHDDLARRHLAQLGQQAGQGVGRVREVDDHPEGLAGVDRLHPAGNRCHLAEAGGDDVLGDPERGGRRGRGQGVGHVEPAPERQRDAVPAPAEGAVGRTDRELVGVGQAERDDRDRRGVGELAAVDVVDVDDPHGRSARREEAGLGGEVALDGAVEVEVVAAEVGEHGHGEAGAVDPVEGEGVGRDLHGDGPAALADHLGQPGLQLGRLGGGERPGQRAHDPGRPAGVLEDGGQQVAGGGLAVRPRDADDGHPLRGVVPQGGGQRPDGRSGVGHDDLGGVEVERMVDEQGGRTRADRIGGEVVAVGRVLPAGSSTGRRRGPDRSRASSPRW